MSRDAVLATAGATACLSLLLAACGRDEAAIDFPTAVMSETTPAVPVAMDKRIRVILFTGTEWCPACQFLDQTVIATPAWQEFAAREIRFRSFDLPRDPAAVSDGVRRIAGQYEISAYPTMLVLDEENEILGRQVGSGAPVENYKWWIRQHGGS